MKPTSSFKRTILNIRRTECLIVVALLMALGSGVHTQSTPSYAITELGTLGGSASEALDINASGQVVGYAWTTGNATFHAVLWQDGTITELGAPVRWNARAINDSGQVAGDSGSHAFRWENNTLTDLGTIGGGWITAMAINAWGDVVGFGFVATAEGTGPSPPGPPSSSTRAFRYLNGAMTDLGTLGGSSSWAYGINDIGQIVGSARVATGSATTHAFLWTDGVMKDLGTLGGNYSSAYAVNASGEVVGAARTSDNRTHPFLWHNDAMTDLGVPDGLDYSWALDINASGQVVGVAGVASLSFESDGVIPLLWQNGAMTDLNTLLPPGSGWVLEWANAINDCGQIVGYGVYNGQYRGFLLTPSDAAQRCPTEATPSRDGTEVPPANQVIDTTGAVWTLGAGGETLRNGVHAAGGYAHSLLWSGGALYAFGSDGQWWRYDSNRWVEYGVSRPGTPSTDPSADGTEVPPASRVIDATGSVWTLGSGGETLRNGIHAAGGYARSLLWTGNLLYAYAPDDQWWQWTGTTWVVYGGRPGNTESADGTEVPPASRVIDATGSVWTLGTRGETLRDGVHAAGGYAHSLLWSGGVLYGFGFDDRWWRWVGTGWVLHGLSPQTPQAFSTLHTRLSFS